MRFGGRRKGLKLKNETEY